MESDDVKMDINHSNDTERTRSGSIGRRQMDADHKMRYCCFLYVQIILRGCRREHCVFVHCSDSLLVEGDENG